MKHAAKLLCLLLSLLLLAGCADGGVSEAEQLALSVRGSCLEASAWTAQVAVTADYGLADLCATDEITIFAEEDTTPPVISVETATPAVMGEYARIGQMRAAAVPYDPEYRAAAASDPAGKL